MLEEIARSIQFDWRIFLFHAINFLLIVFVLVKYVYRPLESVLNERKQKLEEAESTINASKIAILESENQAREIIDNALKKAKTIEENTQQESEKYRQEQLSHTFTEIEYMKSQARIAIEKELESQKAAFAKHARELVVEAAQKVARRPLDKESALTYADKVLAQYNK